MNVLIASAHGALTEREDYFTGGNMFVYFSSEQARNRDFRGPDFFVVLDVDPNPNRERQGWVVWEEGGRYPDVIVELTSGSTAREDYGRKKEIYERVFRTRDYFVYHPFDPQSLQGWHLGGRGYEDIPRGDRGWLWCETLGVWLGVEEGTVQRETAPWLRFFRPDGSLILLPEEEVQQERQRAEAALAEVERLKAQLGEER
jgi:Uma2 family endonuclease